MQKNINIKHLVLLTALTFSFGSISLAATQPDNSAVNKRIEEKSEPTSQDQGASDSDIKITQHIRQDVVKQDSFSTDAKNIKIITADGKVVLKGPVKSISEKKKIEQIAMKVAGKTKVVSEITIVK